MSKSMLMLNKCVSLCASKFNFNAEEAWLMIESECGVKGVVKSVEKSVEKSVVKSVMPMPYNGENDSGKCSGLNKNHGLYTQCSSDRKKGEAYCSKCSKQALKNSHGLPDYGHIDKRSRCYEQGEEFVDPSGKKPIAYLKVMNKLKLTEEEVRGEASIQGVTLDPRHFLSKKSGRPTKEKVEKKEASVAKKGRPKKSKKVLELAGEEDLFASLVMSANSDQLLENQLLENQLLENQLLENQLLEKVEQNVEQKVEVVVEEEVKEEVVVVVEEKVKVVKKVKEPKVKELSEEQKAAKAAKDALVEQKKQEKAAKDALAEQKKQEKEQKVALAEQKKQEKEQKVALAEQKKQEKEQKVALAEQKKQEKEQKKVEKEQKKEKKVNKTNNDDDDRPTPVFVSPPDDTDVVKKVEFEGKKYLKSKITGIIYNMDQDVIGKWNEEKNRIDFNVEDEESEDEYDEDV